MITIYKYPIAITDEQSIQLPKNATILTAAIQQDALYLWAEVDIPHLAVEDRTIRVFGTGVPITEDDRHMRYISTVFIGSLVWHVFEVY